MSIPIKTALWRFARVFVFGGAMALIGYLTNHVDEVPAVWLPIATAVLAALDKFLRETFKGEGE